MSRVVPVAPSEAWGVLEALYAGPLAATLYDEEVTELDHALQSAALAVDAGADDALVAAALLHDVGHLVLDDNLPLDQELTHNFGHDRAGARFLAQAFGPEVTTPVALHVGAKRYLCAIDADYYEGLSPSSRRSLVVQGGPMRPEECERFEGLAGYASAVDVRRWDDLAKVADLIVPPFTAYADLLQRLIVPR